MFKFLPSVNQSHDQVGMFRIVAFGKLHDQPWSCKPKGLYFVAARKQMLVLASGVGIDAPEHLIQFILRMGIGKLDYHADITTPDVCIIRRDRFPRLVVYRTAEATPFPLPKGVAQAEFVAGHFRVFFLPLEQLEEVRL
jgi:hypothetical protein